MEFNDINKEDCCIHSTFPKVEKNIKDEKVVKKLIDIYAGSKGEFTATSQYAYQSFITKPKYESLSEILENISICEMSHVEVISQILLSMDINPKFCKYIDNNQNICNYWSAGSVKYITDIEKFIDYNIKLEEYAIKDYNELLELTDSQNIKEIVSEILKDEKAHFLIFNKIKRELKKEYSSRCADDTNETNAQNINCDSDVKENIDREIVSIFSNTKPINTTPKDIQKEFSKDNTIPVTYNIKDETIQIPISDLNNFTEKELNYISRLEEKNYSSDDIIDG